jgi:hypothetical protein
LKPRTPTEEAAVGVFLRALRAAKRAGNQSTVIIDWHVAGEGVDLFVVPNESGYTYRIECGKAAIR